MESKIRKNLIQKKYQKHISCSYGYKLVCIDYTFSEPFKIYLGKDAVYDFVNNNIGETKCCSDVMKKYFNNKLGMAKEDNEDQDNEDFKNSTKFLMLMLISKRSLSY